MEDKTLVCKDCNSTFSFTVGEQQFYAEKGFTNEPARCPSCRKTHKLNMQKPSGINNQRFSGIE